MTNAIDLICENYERLVTLYMDGFSQYWKLSSFNRNPVATFTTHPSPNCPRFMQRGQPIELSNHQALKANAVSAEIDAAADAFLDSLRAIPLLDFPEVRVDIQFSATQDKKGLYGLRLTIDAVRINTNYLTPKSAVKRLRGYLKAIGSVEQGPPFKEYHVGGRFIMAFCEKTALLKFFAAEAASNNEEGIVEGRLSDKAPHPVSIVCLTDWDDTWRDITAMANSSSD